MVDLKIVFSKSTKDTRNFKLYLPIRDSTNIVDCFE